MRDLTVRPHDLDGEVIEKLNRVIQGTAQYFATRWFTGRQVLRELDAWIRRRVRCMKYQRFSYNDNRRFRLKQCERLGLLRLARRRLRPNLTFLQSQPNLTCLQRVLKVKDSRHSLILA